MARVRIQEKEPLSTSLKSLSLSRTKASLTSSKYLHLKVLLEQLPPSTNYVFSNDGIKREREPYEHEKRRRSREWKEKQTAKSYDFSMDPLVIIRQIWDFFFKFLNSRRTEPETESVTWFEDSGRWGLEWSVNGLAVD